MIDCNNDLLEHLEKIHNNISTAADKIVFDIASHEEEQGTLEPWEISEIVKNSLSSLPEGTKEHTDEIFDIVYEAISEALDKVKGFS